MKTLASLLITIVLILAIPHAVKNAQGGSPAMHEPLRIHNEFKNPEEVVAYYCGRDSSGFVWSGMLNVELRAFTTWNEAPEQEGFFIARDYQITREKVTSDQATVRVHYNLVAVGDANLTRQPAYPAERDVRFELVKDEAGHWKIASPTAADIAPVVLESKFPFGVPTTTEATSGQARQVSSR